MPGATVVVDPQIERVQMPFLVLQLAYLLGVAPLRRSITFVPIVIKLLYAADHLSSHWPIMPD